MHAVQRAAEPDFLGSLRATYSQWQDLNPPDRQRIREALQAVFASLCAYCERDCSDTAEIEHFRPHSKFPSEWLTWLNLVCACPRCNGKKGNLWPEETDAVNQRYTVVSGFIPVSAYVNPNAVSGQRPAQEFFEFHLESDHEGQIVAAAHLSVAEWLRAQRTIEDLDLNDDYGSIDERLPETRTDHLDFVLLEIGDLTTDVDRTESLLREFSQPNQPFSSYVAAYAKSMGIQLP